jgi:hypothetical protein
MDKCDIHVLLGAYVLGLTTRITTELDVLLRARSAYRLEPEVGHVGGLKVGG